MKNRGRQSFEQWNPEGETGMWCHSEFNFEHAEFEGPASADDV